MASQVRKGEETKQSHNPTSKSQERSGKSNERKESSTNEPDPATQKKNWSLQPKNLTKIGSFAKSWIKGFTNTIQNQLSMEPHSSNNTTQDTIASQHKSSTSSGGGKDERNVNDVDDEDDNEENDDEEDEDDEGEEGDESEESEGYEEEEGSLEDEQEAEAKAAAKSIKKEEAVKRGSIDNFAIDDDESPPIRHESKNSLEEAVNEMEKKEGEGEKPKKKKGKKKKGKGKKGKGKKKEQQARAKEQNENLTFEDVYVNKNYKYGSLFTDFHQYYFKGDYLDFESDDFFRATLVSEKTSINNLLFNERRYLNIQDGVFYVTKLETIEHYKLGHVLESYPLSRLVRLDRVDKKKRIDVSFYTEDSGQNIQREMVYEIRNYQKFLRVLNQNLEKVNSSFHILSFNIE